MLIEIVVEGYRLMLIIIVEKEDDSIVRSVEEIYS